MANVIARLLTKRLLMEKELAEKDLGFLVGNKLPMSQ